MAPALFASLLLTVLEAGVPPADANADRRRIQWTPFAAIASARDPAPIFGLGCRF